MCEINSLVKNIKNVFTIFFHRWRCINLPRNETLTLSPTLTPSSANNSVVTYRISFQSFKISSFVVRVEVTVNRITYFPFKDDGTACIFPRLFKRLSNFSVSSFSPLILKTTIPTKFFGWSSKFKFFLSKKDVYLNALQLVSQIDNHLKQGLQIFVPIVRPLWYAFVILLYHNFV